MPAFSSADPNAYLALGIQSALGTLQSTPAKFRFAKYLAGNDAKVQPVVVDIREGGDGFDFGTTYKVGQDVVGQIVCYPRPEFLGQALAIAVGGATWNGASGPAQHDYHSNHASYPFGTIQMAHPGTSLIHLLQDVRITGFTWEFRAGQPHKLTMPFMAIGAGASSGIALVPSYAPEEFFLYHHNPSYAIDGTGDSTIESFTISQGLGIEALQAQSIEKDDIIVHNRDINVEIVRRYQDSTMFKKVMYAGGVEATTAVATGALTVFNQYGSGANLYSIQARLGLLSYRDDVLTELNPDGQTVRETIRGKALKTATAALAVTLKNAHPSAYGS